MLGLDVGEFTEVQVVDAAGNPLAGAQVWADRRHYSFDLPHRPFQTDANGLVQIPLGTDLDRTNLVLRRETKDGLASPSIAYLAGQPPESVALTLSQAHSVSGRVLVPGGAPLADTWIFPESQTPIFLGGEI